jgi:hypothetical protein
MEILPICCINCIGIAKYNLIKDAWPTDTMLDFNYAAEASIERS